MRVPLLVAALALLGGCADTAADSRPRGLVLPPPSYTATLPAPVAVDAWWDGFGDPVLAELIRRGLASNLQADAAADRVRAAAALLRAERSDRLPSLGGGVDAGVRVLSDNEITAGAGLFGLFDPDISGRLAAEERAAAADYAEAGYVLADERRLLAAAIASQYIAYRQAGAQLELLDESTDLQEQTLRIVTLRFEAGLSANLDVRRAASDLAQTQAQRGLIAINRAEAANALAVLLAEPAGTFAPAPYPGGARIPGYRGGPAAGVPADLLRQRTDILAAEARLVRAAADIGIEQADLRPSLSIPASLVIGDGSLGGILSNFLGTVGAALDLPLFDGGRRRAEIAAAEAIADASFANYRLTFLEALAEVENALVAIHAYNQRIESLRQAIEQSETALAQSNALYREGLASLFDVLDAQRQLITSREALIDAQASLAQAHVAFHAAIGSPGVPLNEAITPS